MNKLTSTVTALAVLLTAAACTHMVSGTAESPAATDEAAIRIAGERWNQAYNAQDTDALIALYAADAVLMPETAQTAKGQAEIRKFLTVYAGLFKEGEYKPAVVDAVEIQVSGGLGFRSGTYSVTDKAGASTDTGKWLEIWRKTDGKWSIIRDIWNSDLLPLFPPWAYTGGSAPDR